VLSKRGGVIGAFPKVGDELFQSKIGAFPDGNRSFSRGGGFYPYIQEVNSVLTMTILFYTIIYGNS